jgi:hypothetical protein
LIVRVCGEIIGKERGKFFFEGNLQEWNEGSWWIEWGVSNDGLEFREFRMDAGQSPFLM